MTGSPALLALTADADGGAATLTAAVAEGVDLPQFAVAVLAAEGEQTADRRIFEPGSFTWREPPLTLTLNHDPDQRIGRVVRLGRTDAPDQLTVDNFDAVAGDSGAYVIGLIEFDLGTNAEGDVVNPDALGRSVALEVDGGFLEGVSVEFGNEAYDLDCLELDEDGWCVDYLLVFTAAEIGQVTLTGFQAIGSARVLGTSGGDGSSDDAAAAGEGADRESVTAGARWLPPVPLARRTNLVASAARSAPTAEDFADPGFTEPTALTVDGDRIYGHAALWNTCHVGIADECVIAPRSPSGYAYFHTGEVELADGDRLAVGVLTMGTGHAPIYDAQRRVVPAQAAAAHYDNTGTQAAWVRAGEDEHGIWLAGILNPGLNDLQRRTLRAGAASGDWRRIGGALELVATLAVNVPGFPVPRTQGMVAAGQPAVLVAAGVTTGRSGCGCSGGSHDVTGLERRIARLEATVAAAGVEDAALAALAASVRPGP